MIRTILKTIWSERKINFWVLLELVIVFCIIWFCCDYLFFMLKRYIEPKGFDTENTYLLRVGLKENAPAAKVYDFEYIYDDSTQNHPSQQKVSQFFSQMKNFPGIEHISFSFYAHPYNGANTDATFMIDTFSYNSYNKVVTPEFFDVFKMKLSHGRIFNWNDIVTDKAIMLAPNDESAKKIQYPQNSTIQLGNGKDMQDYSIVGILEKSTYDDYSSYVNFSYFPIDKDQTIIPFTEISIRVKPDSDTNFVKNFTKYIQEYENDDSYYLVSVIPFSSVRKNYSIHMDSNFKSIFSVIIFLVINVFLGILGTFWFSIQSRREEIGLRIALGASKSNVHKMLIDETLLLLLLSSIIATIICINATMVGLLNEIGIPSINSSSREYMGVGIEQYFINYGLTFLFLAVIIIFSVWYPAKKASDIQPVEALRNE